MTTDALRERTGGVCECDASGDDARHGCVTHVACDELCRALREPSAAEEWKAAAVHWRDHGYLSGCSHAC